MLRSIAPVLALIIYGAIASLANPINVPLGSCYYVSTNIPNDMNHIMDYAAKVAMQEGFLDHIIKNRSNFTVNIRAANTLCIGSLAAGKVLPLYLGSDNSTEGRLYSKNVTFPPIVAISGCGCSSSSEAASLLAAYYNVVMVSGHATSPTLSKKALHPYFARVIPPDSNQGVGLASLIQHFGWKLALLIFPSESYAEGIADTFVDFISKKARGIEIVRQSIPHMVLNDVSQAKTYAYEEIKNRVTRVVESRPQPRIFVAPGINWDVAPIVLAIHESGLVTPDTVWIFAEDMCAIRIITNNYVLRNLAQLSATGIPLFNVANKTKWERFPHYLLGMLCLVPQSKGPRYHSAAWHSFWTNLTTQKLRDAGMPAHHHSHNSFFADMNTLNEMIYYPLIFDAMTAILVAIGDMVAAGATVISGEALKVAVFNVSFEGLSGNISFDQNGDRLAPYTISNLQLQSNNFSLIDIGSFDAASGVIFLSHQALFRQGPLVTSGNLTLYPKDRASACNAGFVFLGVRCQPCGVGRFSKGGYGVHCSACGAGKYASARNSSVCSECPQGKYGSKIGQSACPLCPKGRYKSTQCEACLPGTFQSSPGQASCTKCRPGTFANKTAETACANCFRGTFAELEGSIACLKCPRGRYNPAEGQDICGICPRGADCDAGISASKTSGSVTFIAKASYYILGDVATLMPSLNFGSLNRTHDPHSAFGFAKLGPYKCPVPSACVGHNKCHEGMEGPLCGSCSRGFERSAAWRRCGRCPSSLRNYGIAVSMFLLFFIALIIGDRLAYVSAGDLRAISSVVFKIFNNFLIQFAVVASTTQLYSSLKNSIGQAGMSQPLLYPAFAALGVGQALENPTVTIISMPCMLNDFRSTMIPVYFNVLVGWTVIPGTLLVCMLLMLFPMVCAKLCAPVFSLSKTFFPVARSMAVLILYVLHPMVTSLALSILHCEKFDKDTQLDYDTGRLLINTRVDCETDEYKAWQVAAYLCVVFWSFGIPVLIWTLLWHTSRTITLNSTEAFRSYGFLYRGFEAKHYNHEPICMLRRVVYLLTARMPWFSIECRTVFLLTWSLLFFSRHLSLRPYDDRAYARLDDLESWSYYTLVLFLLGRLFQIMSEDMVGDLHRGPNGILENSRCFSSSTCNPDHVPGATILGYVPAHIALFIFLSKGIYLIARAAIWPLEDDALMPTMCSRLLDKRLHFTLKHCDVNDPQTAVLGTSCPEFNELLAKRGLGQSETLKGSERELFRSMIGDMTELMLKHHENCSKEAPEIISVPTFCLQLERLFVACTGVALVNRLKYCTRNKTRNTWGKYFQGNLLDIRKQVRSMITMTRRRSMEDGTFSFSSSESKKCVMRPVSVEELHLALMMLSPKVLANTDSQVISDVVVSSQGLLDQSYVTSLFRSDMDKRRFGTAQLDSETSQARNAGLTILANAEEMVAQVPDLVNGQQATQQYLTCMACSTRCYEHNTVIFCQGCRRLLRHPTQNIERGQHDFSKLLVSL